MHRVSSPYPFQPENSYVTFIRLHKVLFLFSIVYKNNKKTYLGLEMCLESLPIMAIFRPCTSIHLHKALILVSIVDKKIKKHTWDLRCAVS